MGLRTGNKHCEKHQSNGLHYAEHNCQQCKFEERLARAEKALTDAGWTCKEGAEAWKPPLGKKPLFMDRAYIAEAQLIASEIHERGAVERALMVLKHKEEMRKQWADEKRKLMTALEVIKAEVGTSTRAWHIAAVALKGDKHGS